MTEIRLFTSNLIEEIKDLTQKADNLYWIVAFAMESGVRLVLPHLKEAAANGAEIKILIGDYLYITQPKALELLFTELPKAEIRLFESHGTSFHPKAYLFRTSHNAHMIVGSSNLSKSAMVQGIEWNLYAPSTVDEILFDTAQTEFMKQFLAPNTLSLNTETLRNYREAHRKSNLEVAVSEVWAESDEVEAMFGEAEEQPTYERILNYFSPNFLLGITATPDRLDNKDVYSLCDGNVAISIHFLEAIRQNWLSPFTYYGVFDETDYSGLKWRNNSYDEEELLGLQLREEYAVAVLNAWVKEKQTRTIGFCSSVKQAN